MHTTLEQLAHTRDNDYTALEVAYRAATGGELVSDPFGAVRCEAASPSLTASVVIPSCNARDTLVPCLTAIEHSSFNRKYPERLEVVVVDDPVAALEPDYPRVRYVREITRHDPTASVQS